MAERKVLNKYYPSDFDPDKLRTIEQKRTAKICNVRMMLPMTMKCYTCGTYTYIGTKCNMKVEPVQDEDYLGITLKLERVETMNLGKIYSLLKKNIKIIKKWKCVMML